MRIPRWTILVLAPVLLAAATVPARAGEPGYGGLSRVGLRYETGPGTDIYAVDGQLDTGVRFLGGREFIGAGVTQVTSDRVNSRLMIDVASGLIWPRRVSPYITVGLMGGITGASTRTDGAGTSTSVSSTGNHADSAAAWGEAGVRLRLGGGVSVTVSRRRYDFFRSGAGDVVLDVTSVSLLFAYR
ncbi:MAG TPA: hypothetical protein VFA86_09450 [Gammaproteobacteria bacterium]|nr:hypothetical protein [Gammaproteobacteria bacterium]